MTPSSPSNATARNPRASSPRLRPPRHQPDKLGDLIIQIGFKDAARQARDTLGGVHEEFPGRSAAAEGKPGGEFRTPRPVVRLLAATLEPCEGRIHEPACGSGNMLTPAERLVEAHGGNRENVSIFGQESNPTTWRLAHMNLAIHSIEANFSSRPADTFLQPQHPDLKGDFVLTDPPFNVSVWGGQPLENDVRWRFGTPPAGNAHSAWIQHVIHHLAPPMAPAAARPASSRPAARASVGDV